MQPQAERLPVELLLGNHKPQASLLEHLLLRCQLDKAST
jgi:hypothetical protein